MPLAPNSLIKKDEDAFASQKRGRFTHTRRSADRESSFASSFTSFTSSSKKKKKKKKKRDTRARAFVPSRWRRTVVLKKKKKKTKRSWY